MGYFSGIISEAKREITERDLTNEGSFVAVRDAVRFRRKFWHVAEKRAGYMFSFKLYTKLYGFISRMSMVFIIIPITICILTDIMKVFLCHSYRWLSGKYQPFWISREAVAWFWCNLASSQRRPYCVSVNRHSPMGLVSRQWNVVDNLCNVWPSHS